MKSSILPLIRAIFFVLSLWGVADWQPTWADRIEPEMIPPDVTVPFSVPPQSLPLPTQSGTTAPPQAPETVGPAGGQQSPASPATATAAAAEFAGKKDPLATMETSKGTITIRLFRKFAPVTVAHFTELCQKGFYNGLTFHRVEPGFVIQGGCPHGNGSGLYIDPATNQPKFLNLEIHPNLKHNAAGVVAMARFGRNPNSASCQFYITLSPQPKLDGKYTVFGGVLSGMEVVNQIAKGDKILSIKIQEQ